MFVQIQNIIYLIGLDFKHKSSSLQRLLKIIIVPVKPVKNHRPEAMTMIVIHPDSACFQAKMC